MTDTDTTVNPIVVAAYVRNLTRDEIDILAAVVAGRVTVSAGGHIRLENSGVSGSKTQLARTRIAFATVDGAELIHLPGQTYRPTPLGAAVHDALIDARNNRRIQPKMEV